MKIRNDQIEGMGNAADDELASKLLVGLREDHAPHVAGLSDEVVLKRIHYGLTRARRYNITRDSSLAAFVILMFVVTPHFDDYPRNKKILEDPTLRPDLRTKWLLRNTTNDEWDKAKQHCAKSPWPKEMAESAT